MALPYPRQRHFPYWTVRGLIGEGLVLSIPLSPRPMQAGTLRQPASGQDSGDVQSCCDDTDGTILQQTGKPTRTKGIGPLEQVSVTLAAAFSLLFRQTTRKFADLLVVTNLSMGRYNRGAAS